MAEVASAESLGLPSHQSYPATAKSAHGTVDGITTEVTTTSFSDKIVLTISQEGKIAQWFQVALEPRDASSYAGMPQLEMNDEDENGLLPLPHLGVRTLLGASNSERETTGQLCAIQIASAIMAKRPDETRILLVGLGLQTRTHLDEQARDRFFGLLELAIQTI